MTEVGDGLRAVLGAVGEQGHGGGRQGGCDDPRTGEGGAVLQSYSSSTTGRHLTEHTVSWLVSFGHFGGNSGTKQSKM